MRCCHVRLRRMHSARFFSSLFSILSPCRADRADAEFIWIGMIGCAPLALYPTLPSLYLLPSLPCCYEWRHSARSAGAPRLADSPPGGCMHRYITQRMHIHTCTVATPFTCEKWTILRTAHASWPICFSSSCPSIMQLA
jgi:hypothetical protein